MTFNIRSLPFWLFTSIVLWLLLTYSNTSLAADAVTNPYLDKYGTLDSVVLQFKTAAKMWVEPMLPYAQRLFWLLAMLSLVWTLSLMALRSSEIGEIFTEMVKFIMFTGFFYAVLEMAAGPVYGLNTTAPNSMILSFLGIGKAVLESTNHAEMSSLSPSGIVDHGFDIFAHTLSNLSMTAPASWVSTLLAIFVLVMLALIAVNVVILLISAYFFSYIGIFLLGFGGSKWTSDMALNYYRKLLELCVQIMAATFLVAIGKQIIKDMLVNASQTALDSQSLLAAGITALVLYQLVSTVPAMLASIVSGAAIGQVGQFGGGAALAAAGMAGGAIGSTASWGNKQSQNLMGTSAEKLKATASAIASGDPKAKMPSKLKMALSTKNIDDLAVAGSAKALGAAVKGGAHGSVLAAKATAGIAKGGLHAVREVKSFGEVMGTVGGFTREGLGGVTKT